MNKLCLLLALLFVTVGLSQAQTTVPIDNGYRYIFPALSATGTTPVYNAINGFSGGNQGKQFADVYFVQPFVTGVPTTCTFHIWGTAKLIGESPSFPSDYADLSGAIDCSSAGPGGVSLAYKPVSSLVISLTALSGGTTPSVTFYLLGRR